MPGSFMVSAASSHASDVPPGKGVAYRFWTYPSGHQVVGDVKYSDGGPAGKYGWASEAAGKDCTIPYVRYIVDGVPTGTYRIWAYIPDISNLADHATYGANTVINQSSHRGEWVELDRQKTSDGQRGGSLEVGVDQGSDKLSSPSGCDRTGKKVAFDALSFTRVL